MEINPLCLTRELFDVHFFVLSQISYIHMKHFIGGLLLS